jgi:hypothetical protein
MSRSKEFAAGVVHLARWKADRGPHWTEPTPPAPVEAKTTSGHRVVAESMMSSMGEPNAPWRARGYHPDGRLIENRQGDPLEIHRKTPDKAIQALMRHSEFPR